ncbi:MAG: hypothetical protein LBR89_01095 [Holosporales bacterium]|nr:hypothetical protein [Holosporales bacterium]
MCNKKDYAQKKPIFAIHSNGRKLYHVEIDGDELEFVTVPFSDKERVSVEECIKSISSATKILIQLLNNAPGNKINFGAWVSGLRRAFVNTKLEIIEMETLEKCKTKSIQASKDTNGNITVEYSPQVTIQHPLKYAILVSSTIMGKDDTNRYKPDDDIANTAIGGLIFLQAHTMGRMVEVLLDKYGKEISDEEKLSVLVEAFHTGGQTNAKMYIPLMSRRPFSDMLREIVISPRNDANVTDDTSRALWADKKKTPNGAKYLTIFEESMANNIYYRSLQVPNMFYKANYARKYVDEHGNRINFLRDGFIREIDVDSVCRKYYNETESPAFRRKLRFLLENGILSTTFFRLLNNGTKGPNCFKKSYYKDVFKSIERAASGKVVARWVVDPCISGHRAADLNETMVNLGPVSEELGPVPENYREYVEWDEAGQSYDAKDKSKQIRANMVKNDMSVKLVLEERPCDLLSPPWLLSGYDSMGRYQAMPHSHVFSAPFDIGEFGSAIVEYRFINAAFQRDNFLGKPDAIFNDATELFKILKDLHF